MAVTAERSIRIMFTGDVTATNSIAAASNAASPGQMEIKVLASGANTITPPAGATPKSFTIVMPAANTVLVTLKGVTGDTGVALHKTDPTMVSLDSPTGTFVLNAASTVTVRVIWA